MNQLLDSQLNIIKAPKGRAASVRFRQTYRLKKAEEESKKNPVSVNEISDLIISFLNGIEIETTNQPIYENPLPFDYQGMKEEFKLDDERNIDTIAKEVIRGDWGNGTDRKNRLIVAGYDYNAVQRRVNEILS